MDITTLAAANAYTDKKVAEGGGSGGGGGLPVVELTSVLRQVDSGEMYTTELTETESAALSAALASQTPIIINAPLEIDDDAIVQLSGIFNLFAADFASMYSARIFIGGDYISLLVAFEDGVWFVVGVFSDNGIELPALPD